MLYWRHKDAEVDIVLRRERTLIAIEAHKTDEDVHGLQQFLKEKPTALGILVSDTSRQEVDRRILPVPPQLFLLLQ